MRGRRSSQLFLISVLGLWQFHDFPDGQIVFSGLACFPLGRVRHLLEFFRECFAIRTARGIPQLRKHPVPTRARTQALGLPGKFRIHAYPRMPNAGI
jgi:hypothetical protein